MPPGEPVGTKPVDHEGDGKDLLRQADRFQVVPPKPRVLIAYTGGTVGMQKSPRGFKSVPGNLQRLIAQIPQFRAQDVPDFDVREFEPLLDSSNMTPKEWLRIAEFVRDLHAEFDAFLILHGTDTMAFTASALSFMLEGLTKPVLLTGSQIPLAETRNDAQENLLTSLIVLGRHHRRLCGVYLYFDNCLFRGNRTTKVSADAFAAFSSPNFPPVGTVGVDIDVDWELAYPFREPAERVSVVELGSATVTSLRIFPGLKAGHVETLLAPPVQGVVLECFGSGNAPSRNHAFMAALRAATRREVVVVAVTQPLQGTADLRLYATGRALLEAGVVSGYDMTSEAALAKLFYLFAKGHKSREVRTLVQQNLRGELTPPEEAPAMLERLRRRIPGLV